MEKVWKYWDDMTNLILQRLQRTCLHSRGAALNVRDTIRAEQKFVCFIAQLMRKSPKMMDYDAS